MPVPFRTVKIVAYVIRSRGGSLKRKNGAPPTYTLHLPQFGEQGPFTRLQLLSWATQHL